MFLSFVFQLSSSTLTYGFFEALCIHQIGLIILTFFILKWVVLLMSKASSNVPVIANKNPEESRGKEKKEQRIKPCYTIRKTPLIVIGLIILYAFLSNPNSINRKQSDLAYRLSSCVLHSVSFFQLVSVK